MSSSNLMQSLCHSYLSPSRACLRKSRSKSLLYLPLRRRAHWTKPRSTAFSTTTTRSVSQPSTETPASNIDPSFTYNHPSHRPLEGVTVVALEQVISAPYATRQLADLGARVIKIERPPGGDFVRHHDTRVHSKYCSHFVWTNRSKESLSLDVKTPRGIRILKKLIQKADVFIANLAPGATTRLGLSYPDLQKLNERLIYCEVSGYGSSRPYKNKKAYDLLVQAEAGILSITGTKETPSKVGASIADIAAGMYAYSNILGALLQRAKTGKGCYIEVSMLEAMVEWMGFPMYYAMDNQAPPRRMGASHASIYPYGPFEAKDGKILLGVQNEREWKILCERVLSKPELAEDERFVNTDLRSNRREELYEIICGVFREMSVEDVVKRLDESGIANAKLNDMQGIWDHASLRERGRWSEVEIEDGSKTPTLRLPGVAGTTEPRMQKIPRVGEHTEQILKEIGEWKED